MMNLNIKEKDYLNEHLPSKSKFKTDGMFELYIVISHKLELSKKYNRFSLEDFPGCLKDVNKMTVDT